MRSLIRPRLLAGAALLLVLAGAWQYLGSAKAGAQADTGAAAHDLILGTQDSAQPQNMEELLTGVTQDVDAYWTKAFQDAGLPEPRVSYAWIPAGQTAASACGDGEGPGRRRRRVLRGRRHDLHLGEVRDRHLQRRARPGPPRQLAGLRADRRRLLGRLHRRARVRPRDPGRARPLPALRRAAPDDGVRAPGRLLRRHVGQQRLPRRTAWRTATCRRRSTPPSPSATSTPAIRAITARPEQRAAAWNSGFEAGDPSACNEYLQT